MTVRLRAHHLLCMVAYAGRGYSPTFTANYDQVVRRVGAGESIVLVEGPDDICAPLVKEEPRAHCLRPSVRERDAHAAGSLARLLGRPMETGTGLVANPATVKKMRAAFARGSTRKACVGCQWSAFCSTIAGNDYQDTRLLG